MLLTITLFLLSVAVPSTARAQESTPANADSEGFFSGNVTEVAADHVTVARTILGKAPEKHTFRIIDTTKVEGKMKQKSRVTVRYVTGDEGDVALSILVREKSDKQENRFK